jgi:hypothetical protein
VLAGPARESDDEALGAPTDGAAQVQIGRGRVASRQHEGAQRSKFAIEGIDLALETDNLRPDDAQGGPGLLAFILREAEVGADIEQLVLNAGEHGVEA